MSKRAKKQDPKAEKQVTEETKDPTFFLAMWLGMPAVLMILYAIFGQH